MFKIKNRKRVLLIIIPAAVVVLSVGTYAGYEWHESPKFCGICHIMDSYVDGYYDSEMGILASKHAEHGVTCLECHEPSIKEQLRELKVFVTGDYYAELKPRKFENEWCFRCHESHGSYEQIQDSTKRMLDTWGRNPHQSPHYPNLECFHCHSNHDKGTVYCAQCHQGPELDKAWNECPHLDHPIP